MRPPDSRRHLRSRALPPIHVQEGDCWRAASLTAWQLGETHSFPRTCMGYTLTRFCGWMNGEQLVKGFVSCVSAGQRAHNSLSSVYYVFVLVFSSACLIAGQRAHNSLSSADNAGTFVSHTCPRVILYKLCRMREHVELTPYVRLGLGQLRCHFHSCALRSLQLWICRRRLLWFG
jgi:hypothetical protein